MDRRNISLNCYTGCAHGCIYCYARFMQRFHPHPEPLGKFVDIKVNVLTKSCLVLRDLDIFSGRNVRMGTTVTTLDERLRRLWEPNSSSLKQRFRIIAEADSAGLETAIMFGPLLPFLSDSQRSINSMFQRAAELAINVIWVDALNLRPKVRPSVARLLPANEKD